MNEILVSEIFGPTIQGEGALVGVPTVFVRTGGCDFRCRWCDSMHAVDLKNKNHWEPLTATEIMARVWELSGNTPVMLTLSGGNPAQQPLAPLVDLAHDGYNCKVAMETQGTIARAWFRELDYLILSPKPPSSGMRFDGERLNDCIAAAHRADDVAGNRARLSIKVVVMDQKDYDFAKHVWLCFARPLGFPFFLTPGNALGNSDAPFDLQAVIEQSRWLVYQVARDRWFEARVIPQVHTFLWGKELGR